MLYINKMRPIEFFLLMLSIFTIVVAAEAKMVSYVDKNGEMHYVNTDFSKIPEEYRHQVEETTTEDNTTNKEILKEPSAPPAANPTPENTQNTVEVLVSLDCLDCKKLEALLSSHKINYLRYDVNSHPYGQTLYKEIGGELPITKVDNEVIHGLDIQRIVSAARNKKEKPPQNL